MTDRPDCCFDPKHPPPINPEYQLRCISSAKCMGAGDALREMDGLGLIRSNPFIIIRCVVALRCCLDL